MVLGTQIACNIIPGIVLTLGVAVNVPSHITGEEVVGVDQGQSLGLILAGIDATVDETQIHAQAQCVGKATPLVDALVEQRVGERHGIGLESSLGCVDLGENTLVNILTLVPYGIGIGITLQGLGVGHLIQVVDQNLEGISPQDGAGKQVTLVLGAVHHVLDVGECAGIHGAVATVEQVG